MSIVGGHERNGDAPSRRLLLVAPTGYGKTRKLYTMAAAFGHAAVADDLDGVCRALERADPETTVVADDIQTWPLSHHDVLAREVIFGRHPSALMLAGRHCAPSLYEALILVGADIISTDDLRFGRAQIARELDESVNVEQVELVERISDGWPLVARQLIGEVLRTGSTSGLSFSDPFVIEQVGACLDALDHEDIVYLEQIAQLDAFSARVAEALSSGLLERLRIGGIPIETIPGSGLRLVEPVREIVRQRAALDPDLAPSVAVALVQSGLPLDAIRLLIRCGQSDRGAQLMAGLTVGQLDSFSPSDVLATLDLIPEQHDGFPRLHLLRARELGNLGRLDEELVAIESAIASAERSDDEGLGREALAEKLHHRAMMSDGDPALLREIEELESVVDRSQITTRLTDAKSLVLAQSDDPGELALAVELSEAAGRAWEALGEHLRASRALRARVMTMLMPAGRLLEAESAIEHALSLSPFADSDRLTSLVVRVRLDALLGRQNADRTSEASALAQALGITWAEGYVFWARAIHHGIARDVEAVRADFERSWSLIGQLRDHPTGTLMLAEVAEALSRAGDQAEAQQLLARSQMRRSDSPTEVAIAELALAARSGNSTELATAIARCDEVERRWPGWRWKLQMYRAVAATDQRAHWVKQASEAALPWVDRAVVHRFEPGLVADGSDDGIDNVALPAARLSTTRQTQPHVHVLGAFTVSVGDGPQRLGGDRVATLIKTLAIGRGRVPVDVVVERIWPEAAPDEGRRRLKNVLTRTRQRFGPIVQREADSLRFCDSVVLDLVEFVTASQAAARALADNDLSAVALSIQALGLYHGAVLPDDLYDDDVTPVRIAEAGRALSLVDGLLKVSQDALIGPTIHDAIVRIDPYDTDRLERFVSWAVDRGEQGLARSAARGLSVILDELGLEPSLLLRELLDPG